MPRQTTVIPAIRYPTKMAILVFFTGSPSSSRRPSICNECDSMEREVIRSAVTRKDYPAYSQAEDCRSASRTEAASACAEPLTPWAAG
jgi:hypothetical protein